MYAYENFGKQAKQYQADFFPIPIDIEKTIATDTLLREAMTDGDVGKFGEAAGRSIPTDELVKARSSAIDDLLEEVFPTLPSRGVTCTRGGLLHFPPSGSEGWGEPDPLSDQGEGWG